LNYETNEKSVILALLQKFTGHARYCGKRRFIPTIECGQNIFLQQSRKCASKYCEVISAEKLSDLSDAGLRNEGQRGAREFDVWFYLSPYGDLTAAFGTNYISAVDHWVNQGLPNEGRAGAAEVDVGYYLGRHNDLQAAFGANYQSALDHWIAQGFPNEGRRASSTFDVQYYLATYADLQAAFGVAGYSAAFDH
jgi:hypothetical protein